MTPMCPGDARQNPSRQLIELIGKALVDQELRDTLFTDPEGVARSGHLSANETEAIRRLDREKFERAAEEVRWS